MKSSLKSPTRNIVHSRFHDPDEMATALGLSFRVSPLTLATFCCEAMRSDLGGITFNFMHNAVPFRVVGPKPAGILYFSVLLNPADDQKLLAHYRPMDSNTLFGFDSDREADVVMREPLLYCFITISSSMLHEYLDVLDRGDLDARVFAQNQICMGMTIEPVKTYLKELYTLIASQAPCLSNPAFQNLVRQDFMALLIQAIPPRGKTSELPPRPYARADLVRQTEAFLEAHLHQPITLTTVTSELFTSKRTLLYAFKDVLGISPMAYLKVLRLQAVRRLLKTTDAEAKTVAAMAAEHGFYSPGHFCRDYKTMFGETPTETLKHV
jgi:AraC family ethanolamine operon transcriptional activator